MTIIRTNPQIMRDGAARYEQQADGQLATVLSNKDGLLRGFDRLVRSFGMPCIYNLVAA